MNSPNPKSAHRYVVQFFTCVFMATVGWLGSATIVEGQAPEKKGANKAERIVNNDDKSTKALDGDWKTIKAIIDKQAGSWNEGSIDGFMQHYWKSGKLTFSAGGKTTRGWTATRDRYKRRYQTPEQMGKLRFDALEFTSLGRDAALVLGRWQLKKQSETVGGNFSIVFRRIDGHWVIIHDHSSSETP